MLHNVVENNLRHYKDVKFQLHFLMRKRRMLSKAKEPGDRRTFSAEGQAVFIDRRVWRFVSVKNRSPSVPQ